MKRSDNDGKEIFCEKPRTVDRKMVRTWVEAVKAAGGVNQQAPALRVAVGQSIRDTTLEQGHGLNRAAVFGGDPNGDLARFLRRPGQKPLVFLRLGQTFVARYGAEADGYRRTVEVTCSCSVSRMSSADSTCAPVTLLITGNSGFCKITCRSASPTCS